MQLIFCSEACLADYNKAKQINQLKRQKEQAIKNTQTELKKWQK
jgi:hypothetical protein